MAHQRDPAVDTLRGWAIFTMAAANLVGVVLGHMHPFWLRLYGSFAAPLFVTLAGMMVALTARKPGRGLGYYALRGAIVVGIGAGVDALVWGILPFTTFDVLYLIGLSLPLAYGFTQLKLGWRWAIPGAVFAAAPVLQSMLGYSPYPTEYLLDESGPLHLWDNVLRHWLVDGWFPLFPWLGFALVGVNVGLWRWSAERPASLAARGPLLVSAGTLAAGVVVWALAPGALLVRDSYSELFYPPTPGFALAALGVMGLLFALADAMDDSTIARALGLLGRTALFEYVFHLALIEALIRPVWPLVRLGEFAVLYGVLVLAMWLAAYALGAVKARWPGRPFLARLLLGG